MKANARASCRMPEQPPTRAAQSGCLDLHAYEHHVETDRSERVTDMETLTSYRTANVNGIRIFYRQAGPADAPVLLLLHGYPTSSRMFEPLLSRLHAKYRLVAPDYPGFGHSEAPDPTGFTYTFDRLAEVMDGFTKVLGLAQYTLYLQDYGGPVGLRLALAHPHRVEALVIQNAVLHEEGLTPYWELRRAFWKDRKRYEPEIRESLYSVQAGMARHVGGRPEPQRYNPDLWMDEIAFAKRPGQEPILLDLVYDYASNLAQYPRWQAYLRDRRPPTLIVWGKYDPAFSVHGAHAIRRELPEAELHFLEAGHNAINDRPDEISSHIHAFLTRHATSKSETPPPSGNRNRSAQAPTASQTKGAQHGQNHCS